MNRTDQTTTVPEPAIPAATVRVKRDELATRGGDAETKNDWFPAITRGQLIVVIVLSALFLLGSVFPLNHTDLWGHLAYGRLIAETGALPTADPFGVTESIYQPLVDLWWLSQLAGYGWYEAFGLEGLSFAHGLLLLLLGGGVIWALRLRGVGAGWAAAGALATVLIAIPALGTLRPQLLAAAMFPLVLAATQLVRQRVSPLVWLPAMFAVWANVHGSFPLGLVVLAVVTLGAAIERLRRGQNVRQICSNRTVRRLALLCVLSAAATLLNPYGPAQLIAAIEFSRNPVLADVSEWQRLAPLSIGGITFGVSTLVAVIVLALDRRRVQLRNVMLLVLMAAATVAAQRMLVWWAIVWAWVVVPHLARLFTARARRINRHTSYDRYNPQVATRRHTALAILVVLMTLIWAPPTYAVLSGTTRGVGRVVSYETPINLATAVDELDISGTIFTPMDWGDYLIWTSGGRLRPLVYSHVHLLAPEVWGDYRAISAAKPNWLELVDRYGLQYMAVRRRAQFDLYAAAVREPRCRIVYQDQTCVMFEVLPKDTTGQRGKSS